MGETYHNDDIGCFIWNLKETLRIRTTDTSWWRTSETSLGVSFETCLRHCEDVLMRRCYVLLRRCQDVLIRCSRDVPLRRLNDVPSRHRWVSHLRRTCDIAGTYRETLLRRRHNVLLSDGYEACINTGICFILKAKLLPALHQPIM